MANKIEDPAKKLGATAVGAVPDYSAGTFGVAKLARILRAGRRADP
jgi:hypothetical protein